MAATSTNKQPLLVDRVLHVLADMNNSLNNGINITGANTAELLVSAVGTDGAIIEDVYCIARSTTEAVINLYLSSAADYLRPGEGVFIGQIKSATTVAEVVSWASAPKILAPMPQTGGSEAGSAQQFRALYLPKGQNLWVARQSETELTDAPIVGAQGGWY